MLIWFTSANSLNAKGRRDSLEPCKSRSLSLGQAVKASMWMSVIGLLLMLMLRRLELSAVKFRGGMEVMRLFSMYRSCMEAGRVMFVKEVIWLEAQSNSWEHFRDRI